MSISVDSLSYRTDKNGVGYRHCAYHANGKEMRYTHISVPRNPRRSGETLYRVLMLSDSHIGAEHGTWATETRYRFHSGHKLAAWWRTAFVFTADTELLFHVKTTVDIDGAIHTYAADDTAVISANARICFLTNMLISIPDGTEVIFSNGIMPWDRCLLLTDRILYEWDHHPFDCVFLLGDIVSNEENKWKDAEDFGYHYAHGVSYNEYSKLSAMLYRHTGKKIYLDASVNAYKKIDKYFMLPSGCHCSDEYLWDDDYMRSVETCDVTDYTWSMGYLLSATGDTSYADKIERCVFNAGIGAVTEDFKALQYFSCANQVIADSTSNHNDFFKGSKWMSYRPNPGTECCPGNVNRFMPNYVARQYYIDGKGGIYSMLFGESCLTYNGITIEQRTNFPFDETIKYQIKCNAEFTFYVKLPSYAKCYTASGGCASVKKNGFLAFHVTGDTEIEISFDSGIETHEKDGTVYFTKGVLTYAFSVPTDRQIDAAEERSDAEFPAYNMRPNGDWQYGILDEAPTFTAGTCGAWAIGDGLPMLTVKAKKISNWELEQQTKLKWIFGLAKPMIIKEKEGHFTLTPRIPEAPRAVGEPITLTLYPYGLTKLRLTVFPKVE